MTHKELHNRMRTLFNECLSIAATKNSDYAGHEDPFRNLRNCETLGLCTTETGIVVRMSDKLARIANLVCKNKPPVVKNESHKDSLLDLANYAILLAVYLEELRPPK